MAEFPMELLQELVTLVWRPGDNPDMTQRHDVIVAHVKYLEPSSGLGFAIL